MIATVRPALPDVPLELSPSCTSAPIRASRLASVAQRSAASAWISHGAVRNVAQSTMSPTTMSNDLPSGALISVQRRAHAGRLHFSYSKRSTMFGNVLIQFRLPRSNVMESLRPIQAVFAAEFAVRRNAAERFRIVVEHKVLEVLTVRRFIIVPKDRQPPTLRCKPASQFGTRVSSWPLCHDRNVRLNLAVNSRTDVHHAIHQLRASRKIIFLRHSVWTEPRCHVFGIIFVHSCHPAGSFYHLRGHVMIGIFFVHRPRIIANHGIHFQQSEKKNQALAKILPGFGIQAVIAVFQIESFLKAQDFSHLLVVDLIVKYGLAGCSCSGHLVIGRAAKIAISSTCGWIAANTFPACGFPGKDFSMITSSSTRKNRSF